MTAERPPWPMTVDLDDLDEALGALEDLDDDATDDLRRAVQRLRLRAIDETRARNRATTATPEESRP